MACLRAPAAILRPSVLQLAPRTRAPLATCDVTCHLHPDVPPFVPTSSVVWVDLLVGALMFQVYMYCRYRSHRLVGVLFINRSHLIQSADTERLV